MSTKANDPAAAAELDDLRQRVMAAHPAGKSDEAVGIQTFFQGLAQHLIATVNPVAIPQPFAVGDGVDYCGSLVADHGEWRVVAILPERGKVTIGRPDTSRTLTVNERSVRHANVELPRLSPFDIGDVVKYRGSITADHGLWVVRSIDPGTGMVNLDRPSDLRTLRCRPWSLMRPGL